VYRTAFNLARSWAARRRAEQRAHRRWTGTSRPPALPDAPTAIAVRQSVAGLPPRQRAAIVARFYAGLTVDETAAALDCAPGTVKALVHQAIANLRQQGLVDEEEEAVDAAH
jgi:RNA polymerase sigma factor (sigma-70 family)